MSVSSRLPSVTRPQAPGDATVRKRFFRDNFVIFRCRLKRIAFWNWWIFLRAYANFQFSWWSCDHFSAPFRGLYLPNAWSQTLQTSKRHTFRVSAFHRCRWFGVKLFTVGCAPDSRRYRKKCKKMLFLDLAPPRLQNSGIFHNSTRPHLHSDSLLPKSRQSIVFMYDFGCVTSITKNKVVLVWPGAAHMPIAV